MNNFEHFDKNNDLQKRETIRFDYISLSKIISVYSVVILHTNGVFWSFNTKTYKFYWISANIIESVAYFAVPVFTLCIGATLLNFNEKYGIKTYYSKRIIKIIVPLFFWSIILYYYKVYILKNTIKIKIISFEYLWNYYYNHQIYHIFGSLHTFLKGYILIPIFANIEKNKKIRIFTYYFFVLLITQSICPYLINLYNPRLVWIYKINIGYEIYLFAGYIIHNSTLALSIKVLCYFLGIAGLLIHLFGTRILTLKYNKIIKLHKGYLNLPCVLYFCSIFLFIKEITPILIKYINKKYINRIGSLTFGPFFIHMPLIETFRKFFKMNIFGIKYRLFFGILTCTLCLLITRVIKLIPIINYLVP